jgi:hypothetical protein
LTLSGLLDHHRERVRAHPVQELLAGVGVAIGVALVFMTGETAEASNGSGVWRDLAAVRSAPTAQRRSRGA